MNASTRSSGRTLWVAIRSIAVLTLVVVVYTFAITGVGLLFPAQANGSLARDAGGEVVGSALIGQSFTDAAGEPLARYFQPRPSAAGEGYDGGASSGSNLGPENADLIAAIQERKAQVAEFNDVNESEVPADAVTASSSGLDPHISPDYARLQVDRVAAARGLDSSVVADLVESRIQARDLGLLGQPRVNVLELNLALDELDR